MPEFSYRARTIVMQEADLWTIVSILNEDAQLDSGFQSQIVELRDKAKALAREMANYNDQFETEDDD